MTKRLLRDDTQLLTLVGPPGIGKTCLSFSVAHSVLDEFSDGVFLILLASISDPNLVLRTIAQTLGIQEVGPQSSFECLKTHLRDKQMLLVLDNFEQILAAAPQVAELLAVCHFVKILITSRTPLRIRRERQFPVAALALPDMQRLPEVEALRHYGAVELFIERAQAVKPDFSLTDENAQSVAAICNRLDGLPLAIELLSARIRLFPPAALLERLHGRLLLASDGPRDLEPRHRTLNAAIGWSYDLLDVQEKTLFTRLGVFLGGWTMEAAEAVCQPDISIVDGMASLLDKCLVLQKTDSGGEPRFTMLETIREYALERLVEGGESEEIRRRHASFFLTWVESGKGQSLDRIEHSYDNLRGALDWCFTNDLEMGMRLAVALGTYWIQRGRLIDGHSWVQKYLTAWQQEAPVSPKTLCNLLSVAGTVAYFLADLDAVRQHARSILALGHDYQDQLNISNAFFLMGLVALQEQDFERADTLFEERLARSRQAGVAHEIASALLMLSLVAAGQKDYERAYALNTESLALYRQIGGRWGEAFILHNNAVMLEAQGYYGEARALFRQSLTLSYVLDDKRSLSQTLEQIAGLISLDNEHEHAARLMGAAQALRDSIFAVVEPLDHPQHDRVIARLHANLDEAALAAHWAEGGLMTLEQAIECALSEG